MSADIVISLLISAGVISLTEGVKHICKSYIKGISSEEKNG